MQTYRSSLSSILAPLDLDTMLLSLSTLILALVAAAHPPIITFGEPQPTPTPSPASSFIVAASAPATPVHPGGAIAHDVTGKPWP